MELKPGTRVKNYVLERQLGKGASGEVWRAYDETKTVAIKFMNENLMSSASAAKHRERLIREVEALRRLQHPNIPTLFDYDLDYVRPYLAMRYVGGDSYDRLISSGEMLKIPLERRLEAVRELAFALTAAHDAGIIHRDIKPANLTGIDNPFLLDFSISLGKEDAEHTQRFVGTTLYMAPEGVADRVSDNYSFAVVVYEMLFGRHPIYQLGDSIFNQFIAEMRIQNRQWSFPSAIPPNQLPADLRGADLRKLDGVFEKAFGSRDQRYIDLRLFVRDLRAAILPDQYPGIETPLPASAAQAQSVSQPPPPAPVHLSQAPAPPPPPPQAAPVPTPEPEPEEDVPAEESDFLNKAFVNLPAVKPPPEVPAASTKVEHSTTPYDYEAKQRRPVEQPEFDPGTRTDMPAFRRPVDEPEAPASSGLAGAEEMTMMEIRIPPPPAEPELPDIDLDAPDESAPMQLPVARSRTPEPELPDIDLDASAVNVPMVIPEERSPQPEPEVDFAAPDEGTRMEIPIARSRLVEEAEEPSSSGFADPEGMTMMEMRIAPPPTEPEVDFAAPDEGTRMEIPIAPSRPAEPEVDDAGPEDGTRMEIPIAPSRPVEEAEEPSSSGLAGPEEMTMMEMRITPPPVEPEPEPEVSAEDRSMPEMRVPQEEVPDFDRTMPEIRLPQQADMDRTMPEIHVPHPSQVGYGQHMPSQAWQPDAEGFTMMEMRTAEKPSYPDPFENEDFTQLQTGAFEPKVLVDGLPWSARIGRRGRLVIIAVIVLIVLAVIVLVLTTGRSGIP